MSKKKGKKKKKKKKAPSKTRRWSRTLSQVYMYRMTRQIPREKDTRAIMPTLAARMRSADANHRGDRDASSVTNNRLVYAPGSVAAR